MGFSPRQVGEMSLHQYASVVDGWNAANGADGAASSAPTADEFELAKRLHGDG
jgi:hypothetical protein